MNKTPKMTLKITFFKSSKNKNKMRFFVMSQGSLNPKIRFLGQKMCSVARLHTDTHTHTKVTTVGTLSEFQEFFLQPIITDRPNIVRRYDIAIHQSIWVTLQKISILVYTECQCRYITKYFTGVSMVKIDILIGS